MWPRIGVFIAPVDREAGRYRVRILKGWWAGPGTGGMHATLHDAEMILEVGKATSERALIREALRAVADDLAD